MFEDAATEEHLLGEAQEGSRPFIVGQLVVVFKPGHGGEKRGVVGHLALKHRRHAPLHHLVLGLSHDAGRIWRRRGRR